LQRPLQSDPGGSSAGRTTSAPLLAAGRSRW